MDLYAWVGTGYFLACSVSILIFGRLGDLYGRKRLMLLSLILVALGSALSGLSQTMGQLIAFRVLQGVGGGMMIATAFAAPVDLFPDPKERVRWMVMLSVTFAIASGVGPVLGGVVTQALGWRAAFYVIPVTAIAALVLIWRYFPQLRPSVTSPIKLDWVGSALVAWAWVSYCLTSHSLARSLPSAKTQALRRPWCRQPERSAAQWARRLWAW